MIDQPTAEQALKELEVLIGEWTMEAIPPAGEPWPGEARATFEWLEGNQLVLERSTVEMPEAPDGICVIGCDAANGTYYQLYSGRPRGLPGLRDEHRQRRVEAVARGRALRAALHRNDLGRRQPDRWTLGVRRGSSWETDFDLVYTRVG